MNTEYLPNYVFQNDVKKIEEFFSANSDFSRDTTFSFKIKSSHFFSDMNITLPTNDLKLIHIAAASDALDAFKLLEKNGFTINDITSSNCLPIHYARLYGSYNIVCYILSKDPNMVQKAQDNAKHNIFFLTSMSGDARIMELLLQHIDIGLLSNIQQNIIEHTINHGSFDCLKVLLNYGLEYQGDYSLSMLVASNNCPEIVEYLIDHGLDKRPLNYCAPSNHETLLGLMCFYGKQFKELILKVLKRMDDIEPPVPNVSGPVHWICRICDIDITKEFLRHNFDVNRLNNHGKSGFIHLAHNCSFPEDVILEIAKLLINAGFDVNIKTVPSVLEEFSTSIKILYSVVELIIDNGADIYVMTKKGRRLCDEIMSKRNRKLKNLFEKSPLYRNE